MADSAITFTSGEVSTYYAARVPQLKQRHTAEWRGACPIHRGKNDNFAVEPDTGRRFCHSTCGRGEDIPELDVALTCDGFPTRKAEVFRLVGRVELDYRHDGARTNGNTAGMAPSKPPHAGEIRRLDLRHGPHSRRKWSIGPNKTEAAVARVRLIIDRVRWEFVP